MGGHHHEIYRLGKRHIVINVAVEPRNTKHPRPPTFQMLVLKKMGLKPVCVFNTMGGMYRMYGVVNARKYLADNRMAKLMRVADGVEIRVRQAKKAVRKEQPYGVRDKKSKD